MQNNGIKVMLKRQIWDGGGDFTRYMAMKTERNWKTFEQNYTEMIILYAKIAEESDVEMFCIGTELNTFVKQRPQF